MAYATTADVSARLGRALTSSEATQVAGVLDTVAALIAAAAGKPDSWAPSPVPGLLKALSVEKAVGVVANPLNLAAESEQLGAYQHSQTFPRSLDVGIFLTDAEERAVRRAVFGADSGSAQSDSILDDIPWVFYDSACGWPYLGS